MNTTASFAGLVQALTVTTVNAPAAPRRKLPEKKFTGIRQGSNTRKALTLLLAGPKASDELARTLKIEPSAVHPLLAPQKHKHGRVTRVGGLWALTEKGRRDLAS